MVVVRVRASASWSTGLPWIPRPGVHLRLGSSATIDGFTAATFKARKRAHYARPRRLPLDERRFKLTTIAVEIFGRLGESDDELVNQLAVNGQHMTVGRVDGYQSHRAEGRGEEMSSAGHFFRGHTGDRITVVGASVSAGAASVT